MWMLVQMHVGVLGGSLRANVRDGARGCHHANGLIAGSLCLMIYLLQRLNLLE